MTKEQEEKLMGFIHDACSEIESKLTEEEGNILSLDKLSDDDLYKGGFIGMLIHMGCMQEYAKRHPDMLDEEGDPIDYFNRTDELWNEYCPDEETENES